MAPIKYIDIREFREQGFLQEANRLFFHPHGLALEITTVDDDGWDADSERVGALAAVLDGLPQCVVDDVRAVAVAAMNALYPPGSSHVSGVWDYRDDPEGVIFGDNVEDKARKVARAAAERARHRDARARLFGVADVKDSLRGIDDDGAVATYTRDVDVEPLTWFYEDQGGDR